LRVIRRRCQASRVPGVTSRLPRSAAGNCRASAARTARSAQSSVGRAIWRRSTITSCRSAMISASLDAWPRPSRTSQPNSRIVIQYSRRQDTGRDHASTPPQTPNRSSKLTCRVLKRYRRRRFYRPPPYETYPADMWLVTELRPVFATRVIADREACASQQLAPAGRAWPERMVRHRPRPLGWRVRPGCRAGSAGCGRRDR
jgi:hypothetical protein